jgi:hypothetical protein
MTPDQLRQGAALVRCLVEGDETARGPLSDWLLENGCLSPDSCVLRYLREGGAVKAWRDEDAGTVYVRAYPVGTGVVFMLAEFDAWAWEGTYAD